MDVPSIVVTPSAAAEVIETDVPSTCNSPPMGRCRWEERGTGYALANALRPKRGAASRLIEHFAIVGIPPETPLSGFSTNSQNPSILDPQILYHYPNNSDSNSFPGDSISKMCFPSGVSVRAVPKTNSLSFTNEIAFSQLDLIEKSDNSYIFLMSGDNNLLYGICVTQMEMIQDYPSVIPQPVIDTNEAKPVIATETKLNGNEISTSESDADTQVTETALVPNPSSNDSDTTPSNNSSSNEGDTDTTSGAVLSTPAPSTPATPATPSRSAHHSRFEFAALRGYVFLSKFPFFRLHFEVLYGLLGRERLYRIENLMNVMNQAHSGISSIPATISNQPNQVMELLQGYFEKTVPKEGSTLKFNLPGELRAFEFTCPPGNEDNQLAEWGLPTLFQMLSLPNIMALFTAVLLERPTVIVCENLGVLSAVVMSLLPLLRPYVYQGVFVPILPNSWNEYLNAPVPFVIGMRDLTKEQLKQCSDDKLVVFLERDKLVVPKLVIPPLPEEKRLTDRLKQFHKEMHVNTKVTDPYKDKHYVDKVQGVMRAFREYHSWLMDSVIIKHLHLEKLMPATHAMNTSMDGASDGHAVNDPNTLSPEVVSGEDEPRTLSECLDPRRVKEIVQTMPHQCRRFMESFLITQQFNVYTEKLLEIMKKPQPTPAPPPEKKSLAYSPSFNRLKELKAEVRGHARRSSFSDLASMLFSPSSSKKSKDKAADS